MKKILLLLAASLVLLVGCKKDGPQEAEPVADGYTKPVTCPECGAVYSITYTEAERMGDPSDIGKWVTRNTPSNNWMVKKANQDYPFEEWGTNYSKIRFNCQCGHYMGEYNASDLKKQKPGIPDFPFPML